MNIINLKSKLNGFYDKYKKLQFGFLKNGEKKGTWIYKYPHNMKIMYLKGKPREFYFDIKDIYLRDIYISDQSKSPEIHGKDRFQFIENVKIKAYLSSDYYIVRHDFLLNLCNSVNQEFGYILSSARPKFESLIEDSMRFLRVSINKFTYISHDRDYILYNGIIIGHKTFNKLDIVTFPILGQSIRYYTSTKKFALKLNENLIINPLKIIRSDNFVDIIIDLKDTKN